MNLLTRYRRWSLDRSPKRSAWGRFFWLLLVFAAGLALGHFKIYQSAAEPIVNVCATEKEQVLECQNRLVIKDQAMLKLNEVNVDLRERYRFLLSMMVSETQTPPTRLNKTGVNLRHFSVQRLQPSDFQYRLLLDYDQHNAQSSYGLIFEFDRGENIEVSLDSSGFSASQGKRVVLPFVGNVQSEGRILKMSTFYVRQNGKEIFTIQSKYEGAS